MRGFGQRHIENAGIKCNDYAEKADDYGRISTGMKYNAVAVVLFAVGLLGRLVWTITEKAVVKVSVDLHMKVKKRFALKLQQSRGLGNDSVALDKIYENSVEAGGFNQTLERLHALVKIDMLVELRNSATIVNDALP